MFFVHHCPFLLKKSEYQNSRTIDFFFQTLLAVIGNMQDMYCVATDSVTDIATAPTQVSHKTVVDHSRPQSPRFFWSRGRRNGGLWIWSQPLPDVRNFLTSASACVVAFNTTAHAHKLILREGREFILMADREKTSTKRSKESLIFIYAERSRIKAS